MSIMKHVVLFSGGTASALAAVRVRAAIGPDADLFLLFTDTKSEDEDLYRFLWDACRAVKGVMAIVADGRDLWQLFHESRFIGNTRADLCSRVLKREPSRKWLKEHCDPASTTIYVGYGIEEPERYVRFKRAMNADGWTVDAPLLARPWLSKPQRQGILESMGLRIPRMYAEGFEHNNCNGACVKGGHAQWRLLLTRRPEVYAHHEEQERVFRATVGKDVSILRDRRGGVTKPLTLAEFRERHETMPVLPGFLGHDYRNDSDPGPAFACSCFSDVLVPVDGEDEEVQMLLGI